MSGRKIRMSSWQHAMHPLSIHGILKLISPNEPRNQNRGKYLLTGFNNIPHIVLYRGTVMNICTIMEKYIKKCMFSTWVRSRNCRCLVTWFCYQLIAIAQIGPLSFQAAIEHKPKQVRWGGCTLQWSLSGGQHVCISNSQGSITKATKENLKWKTFTT